ncbi:MAG TPA: biotin/lipoyl-binding protein [bacterium]|nr:biotin/lipoyl-binding protein [bacterium]
MPKYLININGEERMVDLVESGDKTYRVTIDGVTYQSHVEEVARAADGGAQETVVVAPVPVVMAAPSAAAAGNEVRAPLAGTVIAVNVAAGAPVRTGEVLLLLEAMKMETEIMALSDGTVATVAVRAGQTVQTGEVLLTMAARG